MAFSPGTSYPGDGARAGHSRDQNIVTLVTWHRVVTAPCHTDTDWILGTQEFLTNTMADPDTLIKAKIHYYCREKQFHSMQFAAVEGMKRFR